MTLRFLAIVILLVTAPFVSSTGSAVPEQDSEILLLDRLRDLSVDLERQHREKLRDLRRYDEVQAIFYERAAEIVSSSDPKVDAEQDFANLFRGFLLVSNSMVPVYPGLACADRADIARPELPTLATLGTFDVVLPNSRKYNPAVFLYAIEYNSTMSALMDYPTIQCEAPKKAPAPKKWDAEKIRPSPAELREVK